MTTAPLASASRPFRALVTRNEDNAHHVAEINDPDAVTGEEELRRLLGVPEAHAARLEVFDEEFGVFARFDWRPGCLAGRMKFRTVATLPTPFLLPSPVDDAAAGSLRDAAQRDVEQWARANQRFNFHVERAGPLLLLGTLLDCAVVGCASYALEEGVKTELFARFTRLGLDKVNRRPGPERARVVTWAVAANYRLKRGHWSIAPGGALTATVPVVRRYVSNGVIEPLCPAAMELVLATLFGLVNSAVAKLSGSGSQQKQKEDAADEFEYVFDWRCRVGKGPAGLSVKAMDRRPEALARFGKGLRHGQRVRIRTGNQQGATVLGVALAGPRDVPSLYLRPDDWAGAGVLETGPVDHWVREIEPIDEPDVVPVGEE